MACKLHPNASGRKSKDQLCPMPASRAFYGMPPFGEANTIPIAKMVPLAPLPESRAQAARIDASALPEAAGARERDGPLLPPSVHGELELAPRRCRPATDHQELRLARMG
eukprot:4112519-Pleurochrysis_carterae.AAC.1